MTRLGWYFSPADKRLAHGDGREIAIGVTHKIDGDPVLCKHGLHASSKLLDACQYAPSGIVWRVRLSGKIKIGEDKMCATKREYIAGGVDISPVLRGFARKQALSVAYLWDMPKIVRRYLETGDESIRDSAWDSAGAAAARAARAAQAAASQDSAWAAAWAAARAARAAQAAQAAAARAAAEKELVRMVNAYIGGKNEGRP